MSTNTSSIGHESGGESIPAVAHPYSAWRVAILRVLAAAHVVVGLAELARIASNLLLQESYIGGPMALVGASPSILPDS